MFHDLSSHHTPCPWQIVVQSNITFNSFETCPCPSQLERWILQDILPSVLSSSRTRWWDWPQVSFMGNWLIHWSWINTCEGLYKLNTCWKESMLNCLVDPGEELRKVEHWPDQVNSWNMGLRFGRNHWTASNVFNILYIRNCWRASRLYLRSSCSHSSESSPLSPPM